MLHDNKHMANTKKLTPYYVTTAVLLILGLLLVGIGEHYKSRWWRAATAARVGGIVLMFFGMGVALLAYHQHEKFWAPPIDGHLFMGLADPGQMASANYAELVARQASHKDKECRVCESACKKCLRHPFGKGCYDAKEKCMKSKCNPNVKHVVMRDCTISGSPDYSNSGTPQAQCAPYG